MAGFELLFENSIPLAEASSYFIQLRSFEKLAGDPIAPPDETGTLEGTFAAPVEQVLEHMGKMVQNELKTQYAYTVFANSLRGLAHHSIAEEFLDHAAKEVDHAEWLLRRMGVLGGPIHVPDIPAPPASTDPIEIVRIMIRLEQEGIRNWRVLRHLVGDENPTRFKIEEYLTAEQEHLDELWQLLPHETRSAVINEGNPEGPSAVKVARQKNKTAMGDLAPLSAGAQGQHTVPPQLPPLTGSAIGQHKVAAKDDKEQAETGRSRAIANLAASFESSKASRGEDIGGITGRVLGGAGGAFVGDRVAKGMRASPSARIAAMLGSAALGQSVGGSVGKSLGHEADRLRFERKLASATGTKKASAIFKLALDELGLASSEAPASFDADVAPVNAAPLYDPEVQQYLMQEQVGRQAEEQASAAFYKKRFEEASQQLQALQQQVQSAQQQTQQLQQQVEQSGQVQQQALSQAKQLQDAAMQNSMAAQAAAAQAMQRSLVSSNELLQQQQLAAGMRDAVQSMKSSLMQLAQQELPPATMLEAGVQPAQLQDQMAQQSAENDMLPTPSPGENQAGAAQGATAVPPGSAGPGDQGPEVGQSAATQGQMPQGMAPAGQTEQAAVDPSKTASDRLIGALLGGTLGGVGSAIESRISNDPLRMKVKALEERDKSGNGGFGNSLNLAQARMRLAMGEFSERHPVASTLMGATSGALMGTEAAPDARKIIQAFRGV